MGSKEQGGSSKISETGALKGIFETCFFVPPIRSFTKYVPLYDVVLALLPGCTIKYRYLAVYTGIYG